MDQQNNNSSVGEYPILHSEEKFCSPMGDYSNVLESIFTGEFPTREFSEVSECSKIALSVNFAIPTDNGTIVTQEASQDFLGRKKENNKIFHILVNSPVTKAYPILVDEFLIKYDITNVHNVSTIEQTLDFLCNKEVEKGTAVPRAIPVTTIKSNIYGSLRTSWGSILPFSPGHFIIRYKQNDFAVIDPFIFSKTYKSIKYHFD